MRLRQMFFAAALLALAAACSNGTSTTSPAVPFTGSASSRTPGLRPHAAASPLAYLYVANYYGNDIAQLVFSNDGKIAPIAPNYPMPSGCAPDAVALVPKLDIALVACYGGSVNLLDIWAHGVLHASAVAPLPVPSPLQVLAPAHGVPNRAYVDGYGKLSALSYSKTSLKLLHAYATSSYPDGMAFYVNPEGHARLFVASADQEQCGSATVSGDVEQWVQTRTGLLTQSNSIRTCAFVSSVAVARDRLFWAGSSVFGGYDLITNKPLPSPSPLWPAYAGPGTNPMGMTAVIPSPVPSPAVLRPRYGGSPYSATGEMQVARSDGTIQIVDADTFKPVVTWKVAKGQVISGGMCEDYAARGDPPSKGVIVNGKSYRRLCWHIEGDTIDVYGITSTGAAVVFETFTAGNLPFTFSLEPIPGYVR